MFFLGFCILGAPLLATGSAGCSSEAQASPPTQTEVETQTQTRAQILQTAYWRQGSGIAIPAGPYDPQLSLAPLIESVHPAVVSIRARSSQKKLSGGGIGSGFVISADGLVVTNHHVVDGNDKVEVHFDDRRRFQATVVGSDPQTDLAVLRLTDAKDLPTVVFGASDTLHVGDWVIAMGSPMGLEQTVTRGIISAKGRGSLGLYRDGYADFLQTDAAINPGNSGGPLFNLAGEVIGINAAVGGHDGLGFAIPIDQAKVVIPKLIEHGKVQRGWLGVSGRDAPADFGALPESGALVDEVHAGGPGAAAGLRAGDRVVEIDGKAIANFDAMRTRIGEFGPSETVALVLVRDGKRQSVSVTLDERPDPDALARLQMPGHLNGPVTPKTKETKGTDLYGGQPARLGVEVRETSEGVVIERVQAGGVGDRLGLKSGDVIEKVNGNDIGSIAEIIGALEGDRSKAAVAVKRGEGQHMAAVSGG